MKLIDNIMERYRERNKLFLALDALFTLSAIYFAIRILSISMPVLSGEKYSTDYPDVSVFAMTFSLGMSYVVRVVEMLFTGKRRYFILYLLATIIVLGVSLLELRWLLI